MKNSDEQALEIELERLRQKLEVMREEHKNQRFENASREFVLSLRHELARHLTFCPCAKGSPSEHLRITNDVLGHRIIFQVNPDSQAREAVFDWSRQHLLSVYSNGQLMATFQIVFDDIDLKFKDRSKEEFMHRCMETLGYSEEAA